MIRLTCNRCNAALQIDDAFAGSTCRCQHCGTIQTVPTPQSGGKRPASPTSSTSRTLYAESRRSTAGSGLDQLAEVVTSSSGLRQARRSGAPAPPPGAEQPPAGAGDRSQRTSLLILLGAIVGVAVGGAAVVMLWKETPAAAPVAHEPAAPVVVAPSFCGLQLNESPVVYLIDRGSSARESLGYVIDATLKSARTLGRDRKFQVLFWDNGQEPISYPPTSPGFATDEIIAAAGRAMESATPFGRSDAAPAVRRASVVNPATVVLISAKGWELDESFVQSVLAARGQATFRIHAVSIGGSDSGEAMEKLAHATGGQYKPVTIAELNQFARGE